MGIRNKKSISWELPYWKDLDIRHSTNIMHVEKNMCENLLGTLLNILRKMKYHENARVDLKKMGIRPKLCPADDDSMLETKNCLKLA